jgi:hypothetical protein
MNPTSNSQRDLLAARTQRIWALVKKETRQIIRDPSSIAVGVGLPIVLILLFGYGLSLDVKDIPVAVVLEDTSPDAAELASAFLLSPYFHTQLVTSMAHAQELILAHTSTVLFAFVRIFHGRSEMEKAKFKSSCMVATPIALESLKDTRKQPLGSGPHAKWRKAERWSVVR